MKKYRLVKFGTRKEPPLSFTIIAVTIIASLLGFIVYLIFTHFITTISILIGIAVVVFFTGIFVIAIKSIIHFFCSR